MLVRAKKLFSGGQINAEGLIFWLRGLKSGHCLLYFTELYIFYRTVLLKLLESTMIFQLKECACPEMATFWLVAHMIRLSSFGTWVASNPSMWISRVRRNTLLRMPQVTFSLIYSLFARRKCRGSDKKTSNLKSNGMAKQAVRRTVCISYRDRTASLFIVLKAVIVRMSACL